MVRHETWPEEFQRRFNAINEQLAAKPDAKREAELLQALYELEWEDAKKHQEQGKASL